MKKKMYLAFIGFLACISLFSIGYASWTIVSGSMSASGNITAEDVMYNNDYIVVENYEPLLYCDYGFVDKETSNIVQNGKNKIAISLKNMKTFNTKFNANNTVKVEFNLKMNNSTGINMLNDSNLPLTIKLSDNPNGNNNVSFTKSINSNTLTMTFMHNIELDVATYYVDLEWLNKTDTGNNLKPTSNWFYTNLKDVLHTPNLFSASVNLDSKGGK